MLKKIGLPTILLNTSELQRIIASKTSNIKRSPKKYSQAFTKLAIFQLAQFDKCVYLDSDLVLIKNIDELFDYPDFSAVEDCAPVHIRNPKYVLGASSFCSGLFVFTPSTAYYQLILKTVTLLLETYSTIAWHDQAVLAYLNQD